jgi:hypothetical protein
MKKHINDTIAEKHEDRRRKHIAGNGPSGTKMYNPSKK